MLLNGASRRLQECGNRRDSTAYFIAARDLITGLR